MVLFCVNIWGVMRVSVPPMMVEGTLQIQCSDKLLMKVE